MEFVVFYRKVINRINRLFRLIHDEYVAYILSRRGFVQEIGHLNVLFYLPAIKTDYIQKEIYRTQNYYEYSNLEFVCKRWKSGVIGLTIEKDVVLDIGANIGNHSLYFLNECNAAFVYCFEPISDTYNILKRNMEINNLSERVELYNVGVGSYHGFAVVENYDVNNIGGTTIRMTNSGNIKVISIDELNLSSKIGLVKIDVEGSEISVLQGMKKTILRDMPYIMIEIRDCCREEGLELLGGMGYKHELLNQGKDYANYLFFK